MSFLQIPENLLAREIADMLPKLLPEGAAQRFRTCLGPPWTPSKAKILQASRMLMAIIRRNVPEILSELPLKTPADNAGSLRDPTDALMAMSTDDLAKILAAARSGRQRGNFSSWRLNS